MNTPLRAIRIADDLWASALQVASARHETVTDVVRAALARYVDEHRDAA